MRNNDLNVLVSLVLASALLGCLSGCAELQQVAESAARQSGGEKLARAIRGGGTLISGLLPIGYEEELTIGQAIALQVVARYGGLFDQAGLTRYVNLVGRAVAMTCDRPDIAYHFADDAAIFVGDTMFAMGCGRLFEGTAEQMFEDDLRWSKRIRFYHLAAAAFSPAQ